MLDALFGRGTVPGGFPLRLRLIEVCVGTQPAAPPRAPLQSSAAASPRLWPGSRSAKRLPNAAITLYSAAGETMLGGQLASWNEQGYPVEHGLHASVRLL